MTALNQLSPICDDFQTLFCGTAPQEEEAFESIAAPVNGLYGDDPEGDKPSKKVRKKAMDRVKKILGK